MLARLVALSEQARKYARECSTGSRFSLRIRNRFDQALRPWEVQPSQNRFVLEGVYLYPEEQAEFSKKSFVLANQRLPASTRALASDVSSASIAEPLHEAEEDHATIRNVFVSL